MTSTTMSDRVWRLLSKERCLDVLAVLDNMSHGESGAALNGVNPLDEALATLESAMSGLMTLSALGVV